MSRSRKRTRACHLKAVNQANNFQRGDEWQALMKRLNPTEEPRIGFAAFSAGLHGWLQEHASALPSPVASEESEGCAYNNESDDKENVSRASPLREVTTNREQQRSSPKTSPGKHRLQQVRVASA